MVARAESADQTPKVRAAMEKKAKGLYKSLSKLVHPDRLPTMCASDVLPAAQAAFDYAQKLEACLRKPQRCELKPLPSDAEARQRHWDL